MPQSSDTDIVLNVKLNAEDVNKTADKLRKNIAGIFDSTAGKELNASMQSLQVNMEKAARKSEELAAKMKEIEGTRVPTREYADLQSELEKTHDQYNKIVDKMLKFEELGGDVSSKTYQGWAYDLEMAELKMGDIKAEMAMLEEDGKAFIPTEADEEYEKLNLQQEELNNKMRIYVERWNEATGRMATAELTQGTAQMRRNMAGLLQTTRSLGMVIPGASSRAARGIIGLSRAFTTLMANPVGGWVIAIATAIAVLSFAIKQVKDLIKKVTEELKQLGKAITAVLKKISVGVIKGLIKVFQGLTRTVKLIGKGFVDLGVFMVKGTMGAINKLISKISSLKSTVMEYLKYMAQWNNGNNAVNRSLSNLTSSLNYVKGSLAAAFVPILTVIEPLLTRFLDKLAQVIEMIGMFFAKITGAKSYIRATRIQEDYADSLSDVGDAAKEAEKQLASYDKLDVIQKQENNSGGGGGGAPGGVGWEEVPLDDFDLDEWLDGLYDAGARFGEWLRDFLNNIPWDKIQEWAGKFGRGLANLINGFVEVEGLAEAVGNAIGQLANTFIEFFYGFLDRLHFDSIGKFLGKALMSAVYAIKWDKLGQVLSLGFNGLFEIIKNFADEVEGYDIGASIGVMIDNFLANIKWDQVKDAMTGVGEDLAGFINGLFDPERFTAIGEFLSESLNSVWTLLDNFFQNLQGEDIGLSLDGLFDGFMQDIDWPTIESAVQGFVTDLAQIFNALITPENMGEIGTALGNVFNILIAGLQTFLDEAHIKEGVQGIVTAITNFLNTFNFASAGQTLGDLALSILTALNDALGNLTDDDWKEIGDKLVEFISNIPWEDIAKNATEISEKLRSGLEIIWNELKESGAFDQIIDFIVDFLAEKENWEKALKRIKSDVIREVVWGKIQEFFTKYPSMDVWLQEKAAEIIGPWVDTICGNMDEEFVRIRDNASAWWGEVQAAIAFKVAEIVVNAHDKWVEMKENLGTKMQEIKDNIVEKWEALKTGVKEKIETLKNNIKEKFELIKAEALGKASLIKETVVSKFRELKDGAVEKFTALRDKVVEVFNSIKEKIKAPINAIIGFVEKMVNGIIDGINLLIEKLNSFSFDVPKGLQDKFGSTIGFNITPLSNVTLPRLAQGAVIPPNKEFAAILGDQKNGVNIETPLETMVQAFKQALAETGGTHEPVILQLNGKVVAQAVWNEEEKRYKQTGRTQFA